MKASSHRRLRILPAVLALAILPLLLSCTADPLSASADLKGTVSIIVRDANTQLPLNDVRVELIGKGTARTASDGRVVFEEVRAGTYFVRLRKTGYEESQHALTVATAGTQEVAALSLNQNFVMRRVGAAVSGRLLLQRQSAPDTTATVPAAGVKIELQMTATGGVTYVTPVRTATTNAGGYFTFDSLPELSTYTLSIPEFVNGGKRFNLGTTSVTAGLLAGQQFTQPHIVLTPVVTGSLQVFAPSALLAQNNPFVLEFSSPVDTSKLTLSAIQLRSHLGVPATNIASTRAWSANLTVLSVIPASGTWNTSLTYSIQLTGVRDNQNRLLPTTTISAIPVAISAP